MPRFIAWFWRNRHPKPLGTCRDGESLELCPDCRGDWQGHSCRTCQLGLVCPTHGNTWI